MAQHGRMKNGYRLFTEYLKGGYRKQLRKGTKIRIDLFGNTPIWKVKELIRCKNWKIEDQYTDGQCSTYYLNIM